MAAWPGSPGTLASLLRIGTAFAALPIALGAMVREVARESRAGAAP